MMHNILVIIITLLLTFILIGLWQGQKAFFLGYAEERPSGIIVIILLFASFSLSIPIVEKMENYKYSQERSLSLDITIDSYINGVGPYLSDKALQSILEQDANERDSYAWIKEQVNLYTGMTNDLKKQRLWKIIKLSSEILRKKLATSESSLFHPPKERFTDLANHIEQALAKSDQLNLFYEMFDVKKDALLLDFWTSCKRFEFIKQEFDNIILRVNLSTREYCNDIAYVFSSPINMKGKKFAAEFFSINADFDIQEVTFVDLNHKECSPPIIAYSRSLWKPIYVEPTSTEFYKCDISLINSIRIRFFSSFSTDVEPIVQIRNPRIETIPDINNEIK